MTSIPYGWTQPVESVYMYVTPHMGSTGYVAAFDMDWTLSRTYKGVWPKSPEDITLLPNRLSKLKELKDKGFTLVIFTNQKSTTDNKKEFNKSRVNNLIKMLGLPVIALISLSDDQYRKPNVRMYKLLETLIPNIKKVYYIGDAAGRKQDFSDSDKKFSQNTNMTFFTPEEIFPSIENMRTEKSVKKIIMPESKNMVVFVGMPGSGKTTYYQKNLNDYVHINQDILKTKAKVLKKIKETMEKGKSLVVDATNPGQNKREEYYKLAEQYGYNIIVIYFVRDGRGWNKLREKPVPGVAYGSYYKYLVEPRVENTPGDLYQIA